MCGTFDGRLPAQVVPIDVRLPQAHAPRRADGRTDSTGIDQQQFDVLAGAIGQLQTCDLKLASGRVDGTRLTQRRGQVGWS
ncbi:MAG: hypothetical protein R3C56_00945 [Pirellulaceae bacterium]